MLRFKVDIKNNVYRNKGFKPLVSPSSNYGDRYKII